MNIFDSIKQKDPDGIKYWRSRELAIALEYANYRNFEDVIERHERHVSTADSPKRIISSMRTK